MPSCTAARSIRPNLSPTQRYTEQKGAFVLPPGVRRPQNLVDPLLDQLQSGPGEFASNLGRSLKHNPFPFTLIGIGLTWLMAANQGGRSEPSDNEAL